MIPAVDGGYRVILADPPWHFVTRSKKGRDRCPDARHYETMSLIDIARLPVGEVAAKDSVLMLWVTDPMLHMAFGIAGAWGFRYSTVGLYWIKTWPHDGRARKSEHPIGTGYWTRANPEQCLLFVRGRPKRVGRGVPKLIAAPRREHSRKPDEQYERIEALLDGPYLELFARAARPGWSAWGNEAGRFSVTMEDANE